MDEPHLLLWARPWARLLPPYVFRGWVGERHLTEKETEAQRDEETLFHIHVLIHPYVTYAFNSLTIQLSAHLSTHPSIHHPLTQLSIHHPLTQLSIHSSTYPSTHLSTHLSVHPSSIHSSNYSFIYLLHIYLHIHPFIQLSIHPSTHPSSCLSIHLSIHPSSIHPAIHSLTHPPIHPSVQQYL